MANNTAAAAAAATKPVPAATRRPAGAPVQKEKAKVLAFVNWRIADEQGETLLRSTKGFSLLDNEYLTLEDKALIELAQNNGGSVVVAAELRVVLHQERPERLDISKIKPLETRR